MFQPGDKITMLNAIKEIVDNDEKRKFLGKNSYQMAFPFFPDNVELQLRKIYEWILF